MNEESGDTTGQGAAAGTTPLSHEGIAAQERQMAMFAHLSALLGGIVTAGWAGSVGCFIGPLVIWLVKKDTMPFVDDQGKEALNFTLPSPSHSWRCCCCRS
jgi:uncharacterized Tic20 family protein